MAGTSQRPEDREPDTARDPAAAREPLVGADPLGLGGTTPPDAPSRAPKPRILALLGEFFRMSRTTAILVTAFLLVGALYLLVREDPVVGFGPPPPPAEPTPTAPATDGDAPDAATDEPTATVGTSPPSGPTPPTEPGTTGERRTSVPTDTPVQDGTGTGGGAGGSAPEPQEPVQEQQQSPGGQQSPDGGAAAE